MLSLDYLPCPVEGTTDDRAAAAQLFDAAERMSGADRRAALARLAAYRSAVLTGLAALAPAGASRNPSSLLLGLPRLPAEHAAVLEHPEVDDALDDAALAVAVARARETAATVIELLAPLDRALRDELSRRIARRATGFVLLLGVVVALMMSTAKAREPVDLAAGKPWRASTKFFDCYPERIECGGVRTAILFHTQEEDSPWFEIDLGAPTRFSSVTVRNRSDAVQERAVPLVLEVSDDRKTWRELARRDEVFQTWHPTFEPVTARFVRVRVTKRTFLHLDGMKVHP